MRKPSSLMTSTGLSGRELRMRPGRFNGLPEPPGLLPQVRQVQQSAV